MKDGRFEPGDIVRITQENQEAMARIDDRDETSCGFIKRGEPWVAENYDYSYPVSFLRVKSMSGEEFRWTKIRKDQFRPRGGLAASCFRLDTFLTEAHRALKEKETDGKNSD